MQDIYSRLLAGESMDDIMNEITAQANEAKARYDEFQRMEAERIAAEAAAKQAELLRQEREISKREAIIDILNSALYFVAEFYPSFGYTVEDIDAIDDATIYALADMTIQLLDLEAAQKAAPKLKVNKVNFDFRALPKKEEANPVLDEAVKPTKTSNDPFADFFKAFGL